MHLFCPRPLHRSLNVTDRHSGFTQQDNYILEIIAPFGIVEIGLVGDENHDTALDQSPCAVHAGKPWHVGGAAINGNSAPASVIDCVSLGMFSPKIFSRTLMSSFNIIVHATGEPIVSQ